MKTITNTVAYLHKNNVAHRDLKPSNILYADESGDPNTIRIVDFGFAKQIRHDNGMLVTPSFTKSYVAPEVISLQQYDVSCDIWSLGCIMFTMLSGTTPFQIHPNDSHEQILAKLNTGNIGLDTKNWSYITDPAKELIRAMLSLDANSRPSAAQVLNHRWIREGLSLPAENLAAMQSAATQSKDVTKAIGTSIAVVNPSRGGKAANGLQLQKPTSSGLFNRRMKKGILPSALKF